MEETLARGREGGRGTERGRGGGESAAPVDFGDISVLYEVYY